MRKAEAVGAGFGACIRGGWWPAVGLIRLWVGRTAREKGLVVILGALGSHSMILSRRVMWAGVHFGKGKLMAKTRQGGCSGVCVPLPRVTVSRLPTMAFVTLFPFK